MKRLFLLTVLLPITLIACGSDKSAEIEWKTELVPEFERRKVLVSKGKHVLLVVGDKPITCALYSAGDKLSNIDYENNMCTGTFELKEQTYLDFIVSYNMKSSDKPVAFTYHATIF